MITVILMGDAEHIDSTNESWNREKERDSEHILKRNQWRWEGREKEDSIGWAGKLMVNDEQLQSGQNKCWRKKIRNLVLTTWL